MLYLAAKTKATSFFGRVIQAWTFSRYCHTELIFSNGEWFSSREFKKGVSFHKGCPDNPLIYDSFPIECTPAEEERLRTWCEEEVDCGYDALALVNFLPISLGYQSETKWFCSEICCAALQQLGWFKGYTPTSVSPKKLVALYHQEKEKHNG